MRRGLVLGKFMPLHNGHIELIKFAQARCDELIVLICATVKEPIAAETRLSWMADTFAENRKVKIQLLIYDENVLPNTSESAKHVSKLWADYLKDKIAQVDIIFSSETYGDFMAGFLNCESVIVDQKRENIPVSSTLIRNNPFKYWEFIPLAVRPYYVKKICLYGSESTGKTTMTQKLAAHFNTIGIPEMAREILEHTYECTEQHLIQIAELHARTINDKIKSANKLLFVDTDINITRSYSKYLFNKELNVSDWVEKANKFDLYLYLYTDAPYVQDGTRISENERNALNEYHRNEIESRHICYELLTGNWDEKFETAVKLVEKLFL